MSIEPATSDHIAARRAAGEDDEAILSGLTKMSGHAPLDRLALLRLLQAIRAAPTDGRSFVAIERRPDLMAAGLAADDIDGFDFDDEEALDAAIARLSAVAKREHRDDSGEKVSVTARRAMPSPNRDLDTDEAQRYSDAIMRELNPDDRKFSASINLDHDGEPFATLDDAARAAKDDLLRNFPQSEAVEAGVNLRKFWLRPGYTYSRAVAGDYDHVPATQWSKVKSFLRNDVTNLHSHPAYGPQSMTPSGSDVEFAKKNNHGGRPSYIYHYQDGTLRRHTPKRGDQGVVIPDHPFAIPNIRR